MKQRLDQALVERGLSRTRSQARDLVKRGCVSVAGVPASKAGLAVDTDDPIEVTPGAQPYVSRGGLKLAAALDAFGLSPRDLVAIDVGASTGGFTQVLLERGARLVHAVDVGTGQLDAALRGDARVVSRDGVDVRTLTDGDISEPAGAVVADVSFVSLTQVLGPALALTAPGAWLVALIKPQFELGRSDIGGGGIVRNEAARERAVERVRTWLEGTAGWHVMGVIESPIAGGGGNREFLIGARRDG